MFCVFDFVSAHLVFDFVSAALVFDFVSAALMFDFVSAFFDIVSDFVSAFFDCERIAVLLLRYYIVHEPVVSELRVVLQYCTVSDARVKSNP